MKISDICEFESLCGKIRKSKKDKSDELCLIVSSGTCGQAKGSLAVITALHESLKKHNLEQEVDIRVTGCHGFCQVEPIVIINPENIFYQNVKPEDAEEIVSETVINKKVINRLLYIDPRTGKRIKHEKDIPFYQKQLRTHLASNALIDPTVIEDYIGNNGYSALCKVLKTKKPEEVINEIKKSGLRGRGGAGFPTGLKWEFCRKAKGDVKYIVCNADEGDPGAYMNRSLLEGNPHSVLEGMLIGAFAIGASEGFIYVRHEYPLAVKNVKIALTQMKEYGLLGKGILGTNFDFAIEVIKGAGAFVCGEETALIASIEGKKGEPRQRPPFPAQEGIWKKPTNINNVETWANIPLIISEGADWFSRVGTERSKGTKIFSLVGKINNTGLVEVPMGITLREMVYDIGGGIPDGKKFKAVQTGGPSGGCIPKEFLDTPVDYESLKALGSIMGSGGMVVMDEDTCMVDTAKYFLEFLQDESCGKCLTCREGIERLLEILNRIAGGTGKEEDIELLKELGELVKDISMCGLGQTAPNPLLSTIRYFKDEYEQHIKYKRCPASVCKEIVSSPCQHTCPIGTEAPVYISLIARGRFEEAFDIIVKDNPLPSVCARVCHHPCEFKCQSGKFGDPISIRSLKRFATDYAFKTGKKHVIKNKKTKKEKIAVIGSGPAGLTAGYYLAGKGYGVTVLESLSLPGGALAAYIPGYRLPKDILNADIENIRNAGVEIKTNVTVGKDILFNELRDKYDAIFIATGAHESLKLGIPNENTAGVLHAMDFLKNINLGKEVKIGKRVGVIGGGNAAVDAARAANRIKGCEKVFVIYRRTINEMPAIKEEVEAAIEEKIEMQLLTAPVKILTKNGKVAGVECIKMKLGEMDESGRKRPIPIKGSEFVIEIDSLIVVAIGEQPDVSFLDRSKFEISKRNTIVVNPETFATNVPGVFAGGDVVKGPNTVIEAMSSGKIAAEMIDKYLQGKPLVREYKVTRPSMYVEPVELTEEEVAEARRPVMPRLPLSARINNFNEVELGLGEKDAIREASRCVRCDLETEDGKKQFKEEVENVKNKT
ncbi:FAD-dependent oxidoreductase [candidate division WOR-3 bacterium]|nr:FAD-dependent oxidoreductase [candidate division WOR-3 bacterium]